MLDRTPLLQAHDLRVTLGATEVLTGVDFAIRQGEIVTVLGPNGSGKSTLMRALLGMIPAGGQVVRAPGLRVGYVPQKLALDRSLPMTVRRFLSLPVRVKDAEAAQVLERVGMAGMGPRLLSGLSGGQLQRVMLARALLGRPQLLVLDEPTSGLDQPGEAAFYRLIAEVRAETGAAVLMVSHDLHVVMAASDRVVCLNHHICCEGTPRVVSAAPEYRALFGLGTQGALALYQHRHDHSHDGVHDHGAHGHHDHGHGHAVEVTGHSGHGHHDHGHDHHGHDHERRHRVEVPRQARDGGELGVKFASGKETPDAS
ncbi:ATP-binding cassette domain-containing protein [Rhodobacteraceae bacterium CYK-10]|uniref:ATP-binding cassette domain-containing protein n=1 Tax=Stagnihabitans tardus TaxID=2699202 RepID=A0AAE4Y7G7_9RHOB|nr:metal ABC transporter ATP-binding protein [Stagnihabitans tardus]NBZ87271.1 ATP-binding cassette domain-containing protein [Stagnihabitans tardus]